MSVGDVSCHHGWTLHMAPPLPEDAQPRAALAVSYFDADRTRVLDWAHDASLKPAMQHSEDLESYEGWLAEVTPVAEHPSLELLQRSG
jgi:hypothetical protein